MSIHVTCESSVSPDPGDYLTVALVEEWLRPIPSGAQLHAILAPGDSDAVRALIAKWSEVRDE